MACACNPGVWETEMGGLFEAYLSTEMILGQRGLHNEILSQNTKKEMGDNSVGKYRLEFE